MVPSERMICSPVMSGKPTTVNRIRSPDFNGITSLSCPEFIPDFIDLITVVALAGNGLVVSVEKVGVIDGLTIGRVDDGIDDGADNSEGIGAAIVGVIVLRKNSP